MSNRKHLDQQSCHIIVADLAELSDLLPVYQSYLSSQEFERAARFVNQSLRDNFTLAHGWLRQQLAAYVGQSPEALQFEKNSYGKPHLVGRPLRFNLSHSKQKVALAITQSVDVGVDIQHHDTKVELEAIAKRFFAAEEVGWFERTSKENQLNLFYKIWSLKEAYMKAVGMGMSLPLSSFAFAENDQGEISLVREPKEKIPVTWCVAYYDCLPSYALALVVDASLGPICLTMNDAEI